MNILDPSALVEQLPTLLPKSSQDQNTSSNEQQLLRSQADALVALCHTILTRLAFRLISLSDSSLPDHYLPSNNGLPSQWNSNGSSYTLHYTHEQSSLHFLLKAVPMGPRFLIHATALESNRTESYEVELDRFTSKSFFPWSPKEPNQSQGSKGEGVRMIEPLVNGFVSSTRISDFLLGFQAKIVQKLVPGLRKEGYEEVHEDRAGQGSSSTQPHPPGPYFPDDDRNPERSRYEPPFHQPGRNPLAVGDRDLDPLGGLGGGPRHPFGPPPLFGGGGGLGGDDGGGMIVGPNHPMFRDRFQPPSAGQGGMGGPRGPFGGDGHLPPGAVPPGARYDPVGPFGQGPLGPGGMPRPGQGTGRGRGRGTGEPDWDEMPPPGNSDYDNMFM